MDSNIRGRGKDYDIYSFNANDLGYICFLFRIFNKKEFSFSRVILPLMILSIIVSADLGLNYVASAVAKLNDGISLHGVFSQFIFGDENWETARFYDYYINSVLISVGLLLIYIISIIIGKDKTKKQG